LSDRRAEVVEFIARVTGSDLQDVCLESVTLTSAQRSAVESLCRRHHIDISQIGIGDTNSAQKPSEDQSWSRSAGDVQRLGVSATDGLPSVGCDIQDIDEFKQCIDNTDYKRSAFLMGFAWPQEIAYCENQPDPVASLAGLMAAKEAIFKAGHQGPLKAIRIEHEGGKPIARRFEVSISHTARTAFAVAMTVPAPPAVKTESQPRPKSSSSQEVGMRRIRVVYQLALLAAVSYLIVVNLWHR
jgi:phosphopantetheine--protein transferase-like protein